MKPGYLLFALLLTGLAAQEDDDEARKGAGVKVSFKESLGLRSRSPQSNFLTSVQMSQHEIDCRLLGHVARWPELAATIFDCHYGMCVNRHSGVILILMSRNQCVKHSNVTELWYR